jgi:hypothetical protein
MYKSKLYLRFLQFANVLNYIFDQEFVDAAVDISIILYKHQKFFQNKLAIDLMNDQIEVNHYKFQIKNNL